MSTCRAGHRLGGPEVVLGIFAWMTLTFMEWILSGPPFGMIIGKQKLQVSRFNLFQPLKNDGGHKLSLPKKWCFQRKFVSVFFWYGVFCCYLFQTWVFKRGFFSVVTTLNPTKPRFFGKTRFLLLLVDGVFIQTASICDHRAAWLTASEEIPSLWQKALGVPLSWTEASGKVAGSLNPW